MEFKKEAQIGEYTVAEKEDGGIIVLYSPGNVKETLRNLAQEVGFDYDEGWNTRQLGKKLIDFVNND